MFSLSVHLFADEKLSIALFLFLISYSTPSSILLQTEVLYLKLYFLETHVTFTHYILNNFINLSTIVFFVNIIKCNIFKNLSYTTKIELRFCNISKFVIILKYKQLAFTSHLYTLLIILLSQQSLTYLLLLLSSYSSLVLSRLSIINLSFKSLNAFYCLSLNSTSHPFSSSHERVLLFL